METQAENRVLEKIDEIAKKSEDGDYIYRGEPEYYEKVSSNLYREYETDIKAEDFKIGVVQDEILKEAKEYATPKMDDTEILTELQHYGGKTNLIDFTTDYHVALFFACDSKTDPSGRVILLPKQSKTYEVIPAPGTIPRAEFQKSIFVQSQSGVVEPDDGVVVCIPADLKSNMLEYLRKEHDISTKTIYNDLHGFIKNRMIHKSAYTELYKGITSQARADSAKTKVERQKWYDKAITHYTEAINLGPANVTAHNNRGNAYRNIGNFTAAIQDFNEAIVLSPKLTEAYTNRGNAYRHTDNFDRAIEDFNKAIDLDPEFTEAYTNRGVAYRHTGKSKKAIKDYSKAIDLDPENATAHNNRGNAYRHTGKSKKAIEDYNKAIDLDPENATAHNNRGNAYRNTGDFDRAIKDFNKAIDLDPENATAHNNRGNAYRHTGNFAAAIQDYSKAIDLDPENATAYNNRGVAYHHTGNFDGAIEDFNKAIDLDPENATAYNNRRQAGLSKKSQSGS